MIGWSYRIAVLALLSLAALPVRSEPTAEQRGLELLRLAQQKMGALATLRADLELTDGSVTHAGTALLKRPGRARVESKDREPELVVANGKSVSTYFAARGEFTQEELSPGGRGIVIPLAPQLQAFFGPDALAVPDGATVAWAGTEKLDDVPCETVEVTLKPLNLAPVLDLLVPPGQDGRPAAGAVGWARRSRRYTIGTETGVVYRLEVSQRLGEQTAATTYQLKNVRLNLPVDDTEFEWRPPARARRIEPEGTPDPKSDLLAPGDTVPDFKLPLPAGGEAALHEALKRNKATVLAFWSYGSGPSRLELPALQRLLDDFKERGLGILAVDRGDLTDVVTKYFADSRFTFPTVLGGRGAAFTVGKPFGVRDVPVTYLLDPEGKVLWAASGFTPDTGRQLRAEVLKALTPPAQGKDPGD